MDMIDSLFWKIMEGQKQFAGEIHAKVDRVYENLNGKFLMSNNKHTIG